MNEYNPQDVQTLVYGHIQQSVWVEAPEVDERVGENTQTIEPRIIEVV